MSLDFDGARLYNSALGEEHESWRAQLRKFLEAEISPFLDEWDENGKIPDELWGKAADFGLLQLGYPEEFGGVSEGIDMHYSNIVAEELGRIGSAGGISSTLLVHSIGLPPVINFAQDKIKNEVATAVLAGKNFARYN